MASRSALIIGIIIAIELLFGLLYLVYQSSPIVTVEATKGVVEYKDFVAILLSAISVVLTAVTVVLALAAIWGYQTFKNRVDSVAETNSILNEKIQKLEQDIIKFNVDTVSDKLAKAQDEDEREDNNG